ncbi:phage DNA ejection protein [Serratia marcescens]|uniref:phage DNA ejection protein n=1 Tax=Serratia marcescens TaxID=615 RepID=UPI001BAE9566|nr:phage DNA ejection protein [Serratia marcescens]MBS3894733.1 phage DNA ejection protein [Serratia marcescens]
MATWQLGGLNSLAPSNSTAMSSQVQQPVQLQPRENYGVELAGAANQLLGNYKQQQYQQAFGQALANGNVDQMKQLYASNPQFFQQTQQGLGLINSDRQQEVGNAAMDIGIASQSGDPQAMQAMLQKHAGILKSLGTNPNDAYQHWQQDPQQFNQINDLMGMHSMGVDKYYDQQLKRAQLAQSGGFEQARLGLQQQGLNQQGAYQAGMLDQGQQRIDSATQMNRIKYLDQQHQTMLKNNADQFARDEAWNKQYGAKQDFINQYNTNMGRFTNNGKAAQELLDTDPGDFNSYFGVKGKAARAIPGSATNGFWAKVGQIQGQARSTGMQQLKGVSRNVTNADADAAEAALLSISPDMPASDAKAALQKWQQYNADAAKGYSQIYRSKADNYSQQAKVPQDALRYLAQNNTPENRKYFFDHYGFMPE